MHDLVQSHTLRKPLIFKIIVYDLNRDVPIREWNVNLSKDGKKQWLIDALVWAATNHKAVEIINIDDDK